MPYTLACGTVLPSVTEILSATETKKQRDRLQQWNLDNPGMAEAARERGNAVHNAVQDYLLQPQPRLPMHPGSVAFGKIKERLHYSALYDTSTQLVCPIAENYYRSILPYLMEIDKVYWAEHEVGGAGNKYVWSSLGYAGRPDIVAVTDENLQLIDVKTTLGQYSSSYRDGAGYAKYCRATTQLAAYAILVEETLGLKPDQLVILVAGEERCQVIEISRQGWDAAQKRWLKRLTKYQKEH